MVKGQNYRLGNSRTKGFTGNNCLLSGEENDNYKKPQEETGSQINHVFSQLLAVSG
jgi:hypothetical protein